MLRSLKLLFISNPNFVNYEEYDSQFIGDWLSKNWNLVFWNYPGYNIDYNDRSVHFSVM